MLLNFQFFVICRRGGRVRLSKFTFPPGYLRELRARVRAVDSRFRSQPMSCGTVECVRSRWYAFFSYADLGPLDEDDSDSDEEFRTDGLILEEAEQAA